MKRYNLYLPILLAMCSFALISCKPKTDPKAEALINEMKVLAKEADIPMFQLEVGEGDDIIVSFESSQIDSIPSLDGASIFQAASLSKPVFAYIIMRMVDKGEIELDTPIYQYTDIDRFEDKEWAKLITPRMVLAHKTGLSDWATRSPTNAEWPTSPIRFKFKPDSAFSYSGEAFSFLQRAVEQIRAQSLQQIAQEEVFIPFNMPNTSYGWMESYYTLAPDGHDENGKSTGKEIFPHENSAYTLRTNVKEYGNFVRGAILEGKGLKPESHKLMLTPDPNLVYDREPRESDKYSSWGLGIAVEQNEELGTIYSHSGSNGDFKCYFMAMPKGNKYMVYMTNSNTGLKILNEVISLCFDDKDVLNAYR